MLNVPLLLRQEKEMEDEAKKVEQWYAAQECDATLMTNDLQLVTK